jgi:hypothetical protein
MKIKFVGIIEQEQRDVLKIILGQSFHGEPTPNHQPNTNMPNDIENTSGSDCPAATCSGDAPDFITELRDLLNRRSMENGSDTPDFILAQYLTDCLRAWNRATKRREDWYGRTPQEVSPPSSTCQP